MRRLDPARSYVSSVRSFPINVEVRHVQTFDAADAARRSHERHHLARDAPVDDPPAEDADAPAHLRPARRLSSRCDRINYGLDQLKAAEETFITRWRLEPKDPAAYARGELVEPVKPITFYIDPATPARWRRYVKEGVEQWKPVFEKAGFKNAIVAKDRADQGAGSRLGHGRRALLDRALDGEPRPQRRRPEHARPAQRRDHQQRDHVVPQPHALVPQPPDGRDGRRESRWRARSTCPKS